MDLLRKLVDSDRALHTWLWASLICNMGIIVTGAVVRITGSGLGCPTWPQCTDDSYVPHGALGIHGAIEFGNRLLTFVLIAAALGAFISAVLRHGARSELFWITLGVGLGIPFQGVIGGITVLTQLNPFVVAFHLLLSVALVVICVWALRVGYRVEPVAVGKGPRWLVVLTFAAAMASIWLGTVVTGSGPHAGDADAVRTGFDIEATARLHAAAAWVFGAGALACLVLFTRARLTLPKRGAIAVVAAGATQGAIGYAQYFLGIPAGIVALHMVGLAILTAAVSWLLVTTRSWHADQPAADEDPALRAA